MHGTTPVAPVFFFFSRKFGGWNISISLLSTTGWEVSLVRHPKQDDGLRFAVIKCHDCKITKAREGVCVGKGEGGG